MLRHVKNLKITEKDLRKIKDQALYNLKNMPESPTDNYFLTQCWVDAVVNVLLKEKKIKKNK